MISAVSQKINYSKNKGFTLVELLVVIFIMSLLSGTVIVSYNQGQGQYQVMQAAQRLAADLRRAQNLALAGQAQDGVTPKGYGVFVQSGSQYVLFYNTQENSSYFSGSIILETIVLDKTTISPIGNTIFFQPPNPITCLDGSGVGSRTFTLVGGNQTRTVTIYTSGRVDIN